MTTQRNQLILNLKYQADQAYFNANECKQAVDMMRVEVATMYDGISEMYSNISHERRLAELADNAAIFLTHTYKVQEYELEVEYWNQEYSNKSMELEEYENMTIEYIKNFDYLRQELINL